MNTPILPVSPDPFDGDVPWSAIAAYVAGRETESDRAQVERWLAKRPGRAEALADLRAAVSALPEARQARTSARWAYVAARLSENDRVERKPVDHVAGQGQSSRGMQAPRGFPTLGRQPLRGAVYVVSSLAVAGVLAVIAFSRSGLHSGRRLLPVHTYITTAGQRATVSLADGSHAQLGPMTTLVVTSHATERRVEVHVTGEALFSVTHRPNTSFQVRTANVVTRVLGTTFLVRRYPKDHMTQIVVAEGRVALASVHKNTQSLASVLTTGTLGTVDDSGHVSVTPNIAVDDYTGWTTGQLVFHNTPIRNVVAEVGRAYNVEIRIVDSARAEQRCNWTVPVAQQSLADILELLGDVLEAHPVRTGGIITFIPGRTATHRSPHQPSFTPERQYGK